MAIEKHCPGCGQTVREDQNTCPNCNKDISALWSAPSGGLTPPQVAAGASTKPWPFAADILAERLASGGFLQKHIVDALLAEAQASGHSFVEVILEKKQMAPEALRNAMSQIFGLPAADLSSVTIDPDLVASFPSESARRHVLLPLHKEGTRLLMVVADPTQAEAIRAVRRALGLTIDLRLASLPDLMPLVHQYFSARLIVLLPSGETLDYPIPHGEIKIGRTDQNDITLPDPTVGSTHAILRAHGNSYQIVDFGSRNGVFVGGQRVNQSQVLNNGDVIQIGQCLLTFKLPLPEAAAGKQGATVILSPDKIHTPMGGIAAIAATSRTATPAAAPAKADEDKEEKKKKKKEKEKEKEKGKKDEDKVKAAYIGATSRIIAQIVGALASVVASILAAMAISGQLKCGSAAETNQLSPPPGAKLVVPTSFGELTPANQAYNASGIVPLADSRFLLCDNNSNDALFELQLTPQGAKAGPLVRRPLKGIGPNEIDDMEAMTVAEENGRRYIFVTTSMCYRKSKAFVGPSPTGMLRLTVESDDSLTAENIVGFREWFVNNCADVGAAAGLEADQGGLNIEGLAWDQKRHALLFGVRTPLVGGKPIVVPVKVRDLAGPWTTSNLEMLPSIALTIPANIAEVSGEQGIRSIEYDSARGRFNVICGNSTSMSPAPFLLYTWDGGDDGRLTWVELWFVQKDKKVGIEQMKAEGMTSGTVGGKPALVFTDDTGGFALIWDDDPRIA
jgi:pSer/pThr/pTyr-binding forkhead associated (FHA) protein